LIILSIVMSAAFDIHAQTCGWEWINPTPPRTDIYRLKHENNVFVGVGASGTIIRSTDGYAWNLMESGVTGDLFGVDWGAGFFVAVGEDAIVRSTTGIDWEVVYEYPGMTLLDVEFSASRFIAIGAGLDGSILTSSFGTGWVLVEVPWAGTPDSIAGSDEGFYVAVGTEIWFSSGGFEWEYEGSVETAQVFDIDATGSKKTGHDLFELDRIDLAWTGTRLLWAGGSELWSWEPDEKWTLVMELGGCPPFSDWLGLAAGPGWAMASGISGCPTPYLDPTVTLTISVDGGATFRNPWETELGGFPALARFGSRWVAIGAIGDVLTSSNGINWDCRNGSCTSLACSDGFADLAKSDDRWLAVGGVGLCDGHLKRRSGGTTAASADGSFWQINVLPGDRFRGVTSPGADFLAVGDGWIGRSDTGQDWTTESSPAGANLYSAASGIGWRVIVGQGGALYVSDDGFTWIKPFLFVTEDLDRVVWDGEVFLALGHGGTILRSIDALNWDTALSATTADLKGGAAGPDGRIIVGDGGVVLASTDGTAWVERRSGVEASLRDVAWGDGRFVAVGWTDDPNGSKPAVVLASSDGVQWTRFPALGEALQRIRWTGESWLAVGGERTMLRAECLGTLIGVEEEHLQVPHGETVDLHVRLSDPVPSDTLLTVVSSHPGAANTPASVTILSGSDTTVVPVSGLSLVPGAVVELRLPDDLGGGLTTAQVTVQPPEWTPRTPSGRVTP
jgi:hypothetical protein